MSCCTSGLPGNCEPPTLQCRRPGGQALKYKKRRGEKKWKKKLEFIVLKYVTDNFCRTITIYVISRDTASYNIFGTKRMRKIQYTNILKKK